MSKNQITILICMWFCITTGYYFYRSSTVLVWDDSPRLAANIFDVESPLRWGENGISSKILKMSFSTITSSGYRPLSTLIDRMGVAFFSKPPTVPNLWFVLIGITLGTLSVCFFLVAKRFLKSNTAALLAAFLFVFSSPVVSGSWIVFAGIQAIVPLAICLGLLCYWHMVDSFRNKTFFFLILCTILFIGPWFREFIGSLTILIIFQEIQRKRKLTLLTFICGIFLFHAIFPTAIPKLIFFSNLPLKSIFAMGFLGAQMENHIKWYVLLHFLTLFPPLILGLVVVSVCITIYKSCQTRIHNIRIKQSTVFLIFWLFLYLSPFLRVFTEQVHLAYAMMPASIIIAKIIESLWRHIRQTKRLVVQYLFISILVIALCDHALNVYGSYRVVNDVNNGILKMASWIKNNIPKGAIIVCNALHVEDIRLYSDDHFTAFWTVTAGIPHPDRAVETPAKLEKLLKENNGKRNIYFLNVDFKYTTNKVGYHSHKYVRNRSVDMEKIGLIHTTTVQYPYLDPFKYFIPRSYISFLGAPDLENDFYRGPAQNGTPFLREVYAEFHVYKVTGKNVNPWLANGPIKLVSKGYKGIQHSISK